MRVVPAGQPSVDRSAASSRSINIELLALAAVTIVVLFGIALTYSAKIGRLDEAREFLVTIRREQPQLSVEWIRQSVPYQTPELMERFLEGMRKAGLED